LGIGGIESKFAQLVGDRMGDADRAIYFERVMRLEQEADIAWMLDPFCS
jgi:hypothetical protein